MKKSLSTALVVAVLTLASACGGGSDSKSDGGSGSSGSSGSGDRPTAAQLQKAIASTYAGTGTSIPDDAAACLAKVFVNSDISDKALKAIIDSDQNYKPSDADTKALTSVQSDAAKCAPAATPSTAPAPEATPTP